MSIKIKNRLLRKIYFWVLVLVIYFNITSVFWNSNIKDDRFIVTCSITSLECREINNNTIYIKKDWYVCKWGKLNKPCSMKSEKFEKKKKKSNSSIKYTFNTSSNRFPNIYPSVSWLNKKSKNNKWNSKNNKETKKENNKKDEKEIKKEEDYIFNDDIDNLKDLQKDIKKKEKRKEEKKKKLVYFDLDINDDNTVLLNNCKYTLQKSNFKDINNTFAKKYIKVLYELWIVKSINWKWILFSPEWEITRGDFLEMVLKSLCIDNKEFKKKIAKDIKNFRANDFITRIEAIEILMVLSDTKIIKYEKSDFTDIKKIKDIKVVETAKHYNIINGQIIKNVLKFEPNRKLTRAESTKIVVWLIRIRQKKEKK